MPRASIYRPMSPWTVTYFVLYLIFISLTSFDLEAIIGGIILFLLLVAGYYLNRWKYQIFYGPVSNNEETPKYSSRRKKKKKRISKDEILFTPAREKRSAVVMVSSVSNEEKKEPKVKIKDGYIWIPELGRQVRTCCYQSARIGDRYCVCGRVVDDDLLALFHPEVKSTK